jgi:hypothetical protein
MKVIKDLIGGSKPQPIELPYNGDQDVNSVTRRYKGSLAKVVDGGEINTGVFVTFAGDGTAMEGIIGILEEDQPITGNYIMTDSTYSFRYRKITPILPSTIIEAEYRATDAAGSTTSDTGASGSASSTALASGQTVTQYTMIGGWIYFLTGSNAGYLHYVRTDDGSNSYTLATALTNAVASGDTLLCIRPPMTRVVDFDATYTGIKSEMATASNTDIILGLSTWISAPGIAKTKLSRAKHDGLKIDNARFFHHFTLPGSSTLENVWIYGIKSS